MRQKFLLLLFAILILSTSACSFLIRGKIPEADTADTGWTERGGCSGGVITHNYAYQYRYEDIDVIMCPYYRGGSAVLFGPPLFPVIPNFVGYLLNDEPVKFYLYVTINSPHDVTMIDFSKVRVQFSKKKILSPSAVHFLYNFDAPDQKYVVSHGSAAFRLHFDIYDTEVKAFQVDLGSMIVGDKDVRLPQLSYRKKNRYYYLWLVIGEAVAPPIPLR
jgi:hypothetical protein